MRPHFTHLVITFKNTENTDSINFKFKLFNKNDITHRWIELVQLAKQLYPISQPDRFYAFNSFHEEEAKALRYIKRDIDIINSHEKIITRKLNDINDQDTLNYLHHIFEVYHGLLDQQNHEFWYNAPEDVKLALHNLNIDVHRCESLMYVNNDEKVINGPRFVTNWYGLPKTHHLWENDYNLFTNYVEFGTVYLTYAEIGKPLLDLYKDKELDDYSYANPEAFKPHDLFSADFDVKFFDSDIRKSRKQRQEMWEYFDKHSSFFTNLGYSKYDPRLYAGLIPLARIDSELSNNEILEIIKNHQFVKYVDFI